MRRSLILFSVLLLAKLVAAQGIIFDQGTWSEVLAKAKKENKVVFVDMYTTWCAPCKMVAKTVFPQEKVGNYYNQHFINYQLDGEKGDGPSVVKKYAVKSYPTFLYLNGDGELLYRFSGAKDANGFLAEAEKVTTTAQFGGWDKMEETYKAGTGNSDFLWAYYNSAAKDRKPEIFNKYLKSLPDEKLFTIEIAKMMDTDLKQYDFDLMKRIVEGRVKMGEQSQEFDFHFTFGSQMLLTRYLNESIAKGDEKWFDELLGLKKVYSALPRTSDPDIDMMEGRGAFFASEDFLKLRYLYANGNNDKLFVKSLEAYMEGFIKENPLDSVAKKREFPETIFKANPDLSFVFIPQLEERSELIISFLGDFVDYYWRLVPTNKAMRERCAAWANYICDLNPYNSVAAMRAANLLYRFDYKKDAVLHLENTLKRQELFLENQQLPPRLKNTISTVVRLLKNKIRDVNANKE